MNPSEKIKQLQSEIESEKRKILNCKHSFGKPFYNPSKETVGYGSKTVAYGSDVYQDYEGYHEVDVPRWTKRCTICGHEEHTTKQKDIVIGKEPDFN